MPCWDPTVRQSEVRVRAGVEAWHLLSVHWLEYRFLVLCTDLTLFLETGSERGMMQEEGVSLLCPWETEEQPREQCSAHTGAGASGPRPGPKTGP